MYCRFDLLSRQPFHEVGTTIIFIFLMTMNHEEVSNHVQIHLASKWQNQNSNRTVVVQLMEVHWGFLSTIETLF
jgi:hypothetical protein